MVRNGRDESVDNDEDGEEIGVAECNWRMNREELGFRGLAASFWWSWSLVLVLGPWPNQKDSSTHQRIDTPCQGVPQEWRPPRLGIHKDMWWKEIGLRVQNLLINFGFDTQHNWGGSYMDYLLTKSVHIFILIYKDSSILHPVIDDDTVWISKNKNQTILVCLLKNLWFVLSNLYKFKFGCWDRL